MTRIFPLLKTLSFIPLVVLGLTLSACSDNTVPTPPKLSDINGPEIEALIVKANDGNVTAQDTLAERYHWANFPQSLLMKLEMETWEDIENRSKTNYQMTYTYLMRGFLDQDEKRSPIDQDSEIKAYVRQQAEAGEAAYQNLMGVYETNAGTISREWFEKAATQGFAPGQLNVGYLHLMDKEYEKAFDRMKQAAHQGYSLAQYYVAAMYATGEGVEKNISQAIEWYQKSADQGFFLAQSDLGILFLAQKDYEKALPLLDKATSQGDGQAQLFLLLTKVVMDKEQLTEYGSVIDREKVQILLETLFKDGYPKGSLRDVVIQSSVRLAGLKETTTPAMRQSQDGPEPEPEPEPEASAE